MGQSNPKPAKMDSSSTYFTIDVNAISFKKAISKGQNSIPDCITGQKATIFSAITLKNMVL